MVVPLRKWWSIDETCTWDFLSLNFNQAKHTQARPNRKELSQSTKDKEQTGERAKIMKNILERLLDTRLKIRLHLADFTVPFVTRISVEIMASFSSVYPCVHIDPGVFTLCYFHRRSIELC